MLDTKARRTAAWLLNDRDNAVNCQLVA